MSLNPFPPLSARSPVAGFLTAALVLCIGFSGCVQSYDDLGPPNLSPLLATCDDPLTIMIHHPDDRAPERLAMDGVRQELERILPPCAIKIHQRNQAPDPPSNGTWTNDELVEVSKQAWAEYRGSRAIIAYYVHGDSPGMLGITYWGNNYAPSVLFLFVDDFTDRDPLEIEKQYRERSTLVHEVGHSIGLVGHVPVINERRPPADVDPCLCHSNNPKSVMYYSNDGAHYLRDHFLGEESWEYRFDDDDILDLVSYQASQGYIPLTDP